MRFTVPGDQLLDDSPLPPATVDKLFLTLLFTVIGVFALGNLKVMDPGALRASVPVTAVAIGMVGLLYLATHRTRSLAAGMLLAYGVLLAVVLARSHLVDAAFYLLATTAVVIAARTLRVHAWRGPLAAAVLASFLIVACRRAYTSFDMLARLQGGSVHQDTLFHAALAGMLKNYGVVSTGLHGLVETPNYVVSHALVAAISRLSGTPVFDAYGVAPWVLFAPLLVLALVTLCLHLGSRGAPAFLWALAPAVLYVASDFLQPWGVYDSYFVSESYLVSLGLFLAALPLLLRRQLSWWHLAGIAVLTLAMAHTKASVGAIYAGLWLVRAVFLAEGGRLRSGAAALLALGCTAWVVLGLAGATSGQLAIDPLHFVRIYTLYGPQLAQAQLAWASGAPLAPSNWLLAATAVGGFVLLHFLPCWLIAAQVAGREGVRKLFTTPIALYALAAAGAGLLVVAALAIPGGSAAYISTVAWFVALPPLLAQVGNWSTGWEFRLRYWQPFAALALLLLMLEGMDRTSTLLNRPAAPPLDPLLARLSAVRDAAPLPVVLQAQAADLAHNPVASCSARPFVFPAISERPWTGVIEPQPRSTCVYAYYGYDLYRLAGPLQQVTRPPVLLPGMTIQPAGQALATAPR